MYVKQAFAARNAKVLVELGELARWKELAGGQERNRLHRSTGNWAWISAVPHRLNDTELSREKFLYNLRLRYGLMPQDIPVNLNGCGNKFLIEHTISCPKGVQVLAQHGAAAKDLGALEDWDLSLALLVRSDER